MSLESFPGSTEDHNQQIPCSLQNTDNFDVAYCRQYFRQVIKNIRIKTEYYVIRIKNNKALIIGSFGGFGGSAPSPNPQAPGE